MHKITKAAAMIPLVAAALCLPPAATAAPLSAPATAPASDLAPSGVTAPADVPVAATPSRSLPVAQANPQASAAVVDSLPEVAKQSSAYIDASIDPATVLFYANGDVVPGQSTVKMLRGAVIKAAGGCGEWTPFWGAPFTMGPVSEQNCGVFGHKGYVRYYAWEANPGVFTQAVVQARGWECKDYVTLPVPGSDCGYRGYTSRFYGIGAGASGGGSVRWGNVMAKPAVRAQSLGAPAGYTGVFR